MPNHSQVRTGSLSHLDRILWSAAFLLGLSHATGALAADPVAGTISCSVSSEEPTELELVGFSFRPYLSDDVRTRQARAVNFDSTCDSSGVTGGKAAISGVLFKLSGKLPDATCSSFQTNASSMSDGRIKIRWKGLNPAGNPMTVGVSRATVDGFSFDEGTTTLTITTAPIATGAFAGEVATLTLAFDSNLTDFASGCGTAALRWLPFGHSSPATIVVQ